MLWHAMPPELNTAGLMAGAGPAPMLQAAAGWEALGAALEAQAVELAAALASLKAVWTGASSERAIRHLPHRGLRLSRPQELTHGRL